MHTMSKLYTQVISLYSTHKVQRAQRRGGVSLHCTLTQKPARPQTGIQCRHADMAFEQLNRGMSQPVN